MEISIIIPTYKRPESLVRTLNSLQEQTLPEFEVIVVDNAASLEIEKLLKEFNTTARIPIRYLPEPKLGVHNARHAGARIAQKPLLVFTDDDATFEANWLESYHNKFIEHPEMVAAGGPVRPKWDGEPPQWLIKFIEEAKQFRSLLSFMEPFKEFRLSTQLYFFSVNMAIRRDILFKVGGFNPEAFGKIWLGDGETGLHKKLTEQGMLIGYIPEAIVYHHIPVNRMNVNYLCLRMANEGACEMYARFHKNMPSRWRLFKQAASITLRHSKSWLKAWTIREQTDIESLIIQLQAARLQSQVKYIGRLISDREFQKLVLKEDWLNEG